MEPTCMCPVPFLLFICADHLSSCHANNVFLDCAGKGHTERKAGGDLVQNNLLCSTLLWSDGAGSVMILCAVWYHLVSFQRTILIMIAHPKRIKGSGSGEEVLFESAKAVGKISWEFVGFFAHTYIVQCYPMTYGVLFCSAFSRAGSQSWTPGLRTSSCSVLARLLLSWLSFLSCLYLSNRWIFPPPLTDEYSNISLPSLLFSSFVFPCLFDFKLNSKTNPLCLFCNKCNISWSVKNTHFVVVKVHLQSTAATDSIGHTRSYPIRSAHDSLNFKMHHFIMQDSKRFKKVEIDRLLW